MKGELRCNTDIHTYPRIAQAVIMGQHKVVKKLLASGEDPDRSTLSYMSFTPLHWAIAHSRLKIAEMLLEAGADIEAHHAGGQTPLHQAIIRGDLEAVQFLIDHGANIEEIWCEELFSIPMSSLNHAIRRGHPEIVRALLHAGAVATFQILDIPPGTKGTIGAYRGIREIYAAELISIRYEKHPDLRDALLQVLRDERPEEVMEWWSSQPGP